MSDPSGTITLHEITLHEEIADTLREHGGGWMSTRELAAEVNRRGRYHKKDGSPVEPFQIHGRTRNYSRIFERDGDRVRLLGSNASSVTTRSPFPSRQVPTAAAPPTERSGTQVTTLLRGVLSALARPAAVSVTADLTLPHQPGVYAGHGDAAVWKELQLGPPPDERPLYVGKSESSLRGRDVRTHFADGRTGSSTLRRSFAALLRDTLGLHGMPRHPAPPRGAGRPNKRQRRELDRMRRGGDSS